MINESDLKSLDLTKAGLLLYITGILVYLLYYSQFKIVTLGLSQPQYILAGLWVLTLYVLLPYLILRLLSLFSIRNSALILCLLLITTYSINIFLLFKFAYAGKLNFLHAGLISLLEILCYADFSRKGEGERASFSFYLHDFNLRTVFILLFASIHFAWFVFPFISQSYGGGAAVEVIVIPNKENKDLLLDNLIGQGNVNKPRINPNLDSYTMLLLCESGDSYYFLFKRGAMVISNGVAEDKFLGYSVQRVPKSSIMRIDTKTPVPFNVKSD